MTNTFIMAKRTRVGETWVTKYLKSMGVDIRRDSKFGISTNDRNDAMVFTDDAQIDFLDGVWTKEPIIDMSINEDYEYEKPGGFDHMST